MITFVDDLVKAYFIEYAVALEELASFERFHIEDVQCNVAIGYQRYQLIRGRAIVYRVTDERFYQYPTILVKYFDSREQTAGFQDGSALFARELAFFRILLPVLVEVDASVAELVPKLYASRLAGSGFANKSAILMECPRGHLDLKCTSFLEAALVSLMVQKIGHFHACSFVARGKRPDLLSNPNYSHPMFAHYGRVLPTLERCLELLRTDPANRQPNGHLKGGLSRLSQIINDFGVYLNAGFARDAQNNCWVLCHQNYSRANVTFELDNGVPVSVKILNWQSMGFASLAVDLVIPLFVETNSRPLTPLIDWLLEVYEDAWRTVPEYLRPSRRCILREIRRCFPVALYALADRVVRAHSEAEADNLLFPRTLWNENLIVDFCTCLIAEDYI